MRSYHNGTNAALLTEVATRGHARHSVPRPLRTGSWLAVAIGCVAAIAGFTLWLGPAPIMAPWDVFTLLNGGYRIYEGQSPGAGFSNPIGPLVYGLVSLGMRVQGFPSLAAVPISQVIFLFIAAALAWSVAWRRVPAPYAALFTVLVSILAVSDRPLGYSFSITTYAMLYNRDGWLLYASLLLLVLLPRRDNSPGGRAAAADGIALGLLLGLLFYDKVTFFIAAICAVALGLILGTLPRRPLLGAGAVAGFAVVGTLARLLFQLNLAGYITDLIAAAQVQEGSARLGDLERSVAFNTPIAIVAIVVVGILLLRAHRAGATRRQLIRMLVPAMFVLASSLLISTGNAYEEGDIPALVVIPLLIIASLEERLPWWAGGPVIARRTLRSSRETTILAFALAGLLFGTTVPVAAQDALALGKAVADRGYVARPPAGQRFGAAAIGDFVIPADSHWQTAYRTARNLPAMINNGLVLLRARVRPGQTVFTLAYTDPFSMALGLPLSSCGPLWWDLGFDFDASHHPSAQCAIGDASWVIIPRMIPGQGGGQQSVSVMLGLYSSYLNAHYQQVQQTADWTLLGRRS
jgi:hypothetical protein